MRKLSQCTKQIGEQQAAKLVRSHAQLLFFLGKQTCYVCHLLYKSQFLSKLNQPKSLFFKMATKPACVLTPKQIRFQVIRQPPVLIPPVAPTPYEFKELSNLDDQEGLRFQLPVIMFYPGRSNRKELDPVLVIKNALSKALVPYYPLAGRVREKKGRKLVVECNTKGVLFVEADAPDLTLDDFGESGLVTPVPCFDQLFYNDPRFADILHSPLLIFQVRCVGFILAFRMNHTLLDAVGLFQFLNAVAEISRGEKSLSVRPVWERHLLCARDPPRVTVSIPTYDYDNNVLRPSHITNNDDMVKHSFFFGATEISALRRLVPPHLKSSTTFEVLSACLWRCRTIAIQPDPDEYVRFMFLFNARSKFNNPIPIGYYGNGVVFPMAISTAIELSQNSLGYAIQLIKKAKAQVTEEYVRSVVDLMEIKGRPMFNPTRNFTVSDITRDGYTFEYLDFGWGLPTYAGPTLDGLDKELADLLSVYVSFKNSKGEKGLVFMMCLPSLAMKRFHQELRKMLDPISSTGSFGPVSSAL